MRRAALLVAMVLLAVGLLTLPDFLAGGGDGELSFATESADLGGVPLDQVAPFRFEMRNVGSKPVKIAKPQITALEGC